MVYLSYAHCGMPIGILGLVCTAGVDVHIAGGYSLPLCGYQHVGSGFETMGYVMSLVCDVIGALPRCTPSR